MRDAYYKKNSTRLKDKQRDYYKKLRLLALQAYSAEMPFCACCGEKEIKFLALDHIEGGGTKHRLALNLRGSRMTIWLMQQGYPSGYQVLCHNCNMAKGFYGKCPHRS